MNDEDRERSERIPVPHSGRPPRRAAPSRRPLTRMERRRNLVHVQAILDQHFRRDKAS